LTSNENLGILTTMMNTKYKIYMLSLRRSFGAVIVF